MKKIIIAIITLIILALFPLYQLHALNGIEMQSFAITKVSLNKNLQFFVEGSGELYNPSLIPVTIKEIRYEAYVNNEQMMNGTISGKTIPAQSAESFIFSQQIDWVPDIDTALQITAGKNVTMTIQTEADVSYLSIFTITGKKQTTINIGRILRPVLEKQITAISNAIGLFSS